VDQLGNGDAPGPGGKRRPRGWLWVAGDPSTSRSGAWTLGRVTGHMLAAQPSWVRGETHDVRRGPPAFWSELCVSGVGFVQLRSRSAVTPSGGSDSRLPSGISTYSVAELTPLWACAEPSGRIRTGKRHTLIGRA
jgi:hypothetical protein